MYCRYILLEVVQLAEVDVQLGVVFGRLGRGRRVCDVLNDLGFPGRKSRRQEVQAMQTAHEGGGGSGGRCGVN